MARGLVASYPPVVLDLHDPARSDDGLVAGLRAEGMVVIPIERAPGSAPAAEQARAVAVLLADAPPADVLLARVPPWLLGVAAQARAAGLEGGGPPLWILKPPPVSSGAVIGRTEAHVRAWLETEARATADHVLPQPPPARVAAWIAAAHRAPTPTPTPPPLPANRPGIAVVMVHHDRPGWLAQALDSLACQRPRPPAQVVVVDAASADPAARAAACRLTRAWTAAPIRFVVRDDASLGAARMAGVQALRESRAAASDWVLFMDDDNALVPDALHVFAGAAATGAADIWTCWASLFCGPDPASATDTTLYAPLGPVPALLGGDDNQLGDATLLIRVAAFMALGGFDPDPTTGAEDWDLLVRAWLEGVPQRVIPRPLLHKRLSSTSMSATMDRTRAAARVRGRLRARGLPV